MKPILHALTMSGVEEGRIGCDRPDREGSTPNGRRCPGLCHLCLPRLDLGRRAGSPKFPDFPKLAWKQIVEIAIYHVWIFPITTASSTPSRSASLPHRNPSSRVGRRPSSVVFSRERRQGSERAGRPTEASGSTSGPTDIHPDPARRGCEGARPTRDRGDHSLTLLATARAVLPWHRPNRAPRLAGPLRPRMARAASLRGRDHPRTRGSQDVTPHPPFGGSSGNPKSDLIRHRLEGWSS